MPSARKVPHAAAALALLCCVGALAKATPALATTAFAEGAGEGGGGQRAHGAGRLFHPRGMAVNNSCALHEPPLTESSSPETCAEFDPHDGDLYIADEGNRRIDRFGPEGNFELAWGAGVADGKSEALQTCGPEAGNATSRCFAGTNGASGPGAMTPADVAVNPASSEVFVSDVAHNRIQAFGPDGEFLRAFGEGSGLLSGNVQLSFGPSGDLWAGGEERVQRFSPAGAQTGEVALAGLGRVGDLAVGPAGDFYAVVNEPYGGGSLGEEGVHHYDSEGHELAEVGVSPHGPGYYFKVIALDAAGDLYVAERPAPKAPAVIRRLDPSGALASQFGAGQVLGNGGPRGIAIGERAGALYADSSSAPESPADPKEFWYAQRFELPAPGPLPAEARAEAPLPTEATLEATLNPEGAPTTYRFQHTTLAEYEAHGFAGCGSPANPGCAQGPEETLEEGGEPYKGFEDRPVSASLEGLIPDTPYRFRLVAENADGEASAEGSFKTRTAVGIEAQWASEAAARDATLDATLDPRGAPGEWWMEYDTSPYSPGEAPHGTRVAGGPLPGGSGALHRSVALGGLVPSTTYHYRFAGRDERGAVCEAPGTPCTTYGEERSFTTGPARLGFELPDGRAWEMVSPAEKHGGRIEAKSQGPVQAAAGGDALAYLSTGSIERYPEGSRAIEASSALARRGPGGVWSDHDITPPHNEVQGIGTGHGVEYKLFSADLSAALLEPADATPLSAAASERTPYLRQNAEPPTYTPLVTAANVPAGTRFGKEATGGEGVTVQGATPDLSHVVLSSSAPLVVGAPTNALYEWTAGGLQTLSVLPGGGVVGASPGSKLSRRGAISTDGSRVFFSTFSGSATISGLYLRDAARGESLQLDAVQGGFGTGGAEPFFQGAAADGSVAFFTDAQNLTPNANESGRDLYRCAVVVKGGKLACELSDISAQTASFAESAEVLGIAPGVGEDGDSIYFVARGVLDARPNGRGESAASGQLNLYLWRAGAGTRFIATLAGGDALDWGGADTPNIGKGSLELSAAASPSGRYLAFMSQRSLTGYDNTDVESPEPCGEEHPKAVCDQEVFRYDAGDDRLDCASCNPSGARPRALTLAGPSTSGELAPNFDPQFLWTGRAVAALLPDAPPVSGAVASYLHRPRAVHDDGRVFFNAADSLVAADSNGNGDVYEYEPFAGEEGAPPADSCTPASSDAGTAVVAGGCVSLISSGAAEGTAAFLDASESGNDVFFYTPARLSVTDEDSETDVYDARVGGEPAALSPLIECQGEACQPPPVAPAYAPGATASHHGVGNLGAAARGRCAKPARKARRLSRRARRAQRSAGRLARGGGAPGKARRARRRASHLAGAAKRQARQARRCRRRSKKRAKAKRGEARRAHRARAHGRKSK